MTEESKKAGLRGEEGGRRFWQPQFEQGLVLGFVHAFIHTCAQPCVLHVSICNSVALDAPHTLDIVTFKRICNSAEKSH